MKLRAFLLFSFIICFLLSACSGGGGGGDSSSSTGTLQVGLTDAATSEYQAVYISVREVQVHRDGGDWQTISTPNKTINLLDLVNGVREALAIVTLPAGHYTQMRLVLMNKPDDDINILHVKHPYANYFIDPLDNPTELKVPSAFESGLKIVKGFDISPNQTTELVLDFDVSKSIVMAGSSGNWLLKPTIKMLLSTEWSIVDGSVMSGGLPVVGALVSAQVYNPAAADPKDRVIVESATITDDRGLYKIFLAPGTYNLVCYKDGYSPAAISITVVSGSVSHKDFSLGTVPVSTISGSVSIPGSGEGLYATLSIRQEISIGGTPAQIEVKSLNVANGAEYNAALNTGSYTIVSHTYGEDTQSGNYSLTAGTNTINFTF